MQKPRYSVTRGRNGRFNFTLLAGRSRIVGSVAISLQDGQSRAAMDKAVESQIAALVGELVEAVEDDVRKTPRERVRLRGEVGEVADHRREER